MTRTTMTDISFPSVIRVKPETNENLVFLHRVAMTSNPDNVRQVRATQHLLLDLAVRDLRDRFGNDPDGLMKALVDTVIERAS